MWRKEEKLLPTFDHRQQDLKMAAGIWLTKTASATAIIPTIGHPSNKTLCPQTMTHQKCCRRWPPDRQFWPPPAGPPGPLHMCPKWRPPWGRRHWWAETHTRRVDCACVTEPVFMGYFAIYSATVVLIFCRLWFWYFPRVPNYKIAHIVKTKEPFFLSWDGSS